MKKTILLSLLIGFLSVHPSFAKPVKKEKTTKAASNISSLGWKLVNAQEIMKGFEQGKEKVKVIVNLAEPPKIRAKVRWK